MFQVKPHHDAKVMFLSNQMNFDFKSFWKQFFKYFLKFNLFLSTHDEVITQSKNTIIRQIQKQIIQSSDQFLEYQLLGNVKSMYFHLLKLFSRLQVNSFSTLIKEKKRYQVRVY
jgi:hypothetical protein